MMRPALRMALGLSLAMSPAVAAAEDQPAPPPEICAADAGWADDDWMETGREFEESFREFDWRFVAFSARLAKAVPAEDAMPDAAAIAGLRTAMDDVYRALAHLVPLREAGDEAWPMKFLLEAIPGGIPLPDFDPPDRGEVLRAAFVRELLTVSIPGPERSQVRFLARLDMTRALLDAEAASPTDIGALRILAGGALDEAYEADFRKPALRVLDNGWHTSLASRLRRQVVDMCGEAAQ